MTSVLLAVAQRHFQTTLKRQNQPHCMILHLDFVQRTSTGPAFVTIKDIKLGRQTSTIQVTLTQANRDEIIGILTHTNIGAEAGISLPTSFQLVPPAPAANLSKFSSGGDGTWEKWTTPRPDFRKAANQMEIFLPRGDRTARGVIDQWIRFANGERFTSVSLGLIADMFPQMTESYDADQEAMAMAGVTPTQLLRHWYPTLALNLDVKKVLPEGGLEWLFVRVVAKQIRNGRKDLEVIIMDEGGEVVALSHHVAMIVDVARNLAKRRDKKEEGDQSKL